MPKSEDKIQLDFNTNLSFAQELRETPLGSGRFLPASKTIAYPDVKGTAKIRFSPDFYSLDIELNIVGDLTGDQEVTLSHMHLDDTSKTGPLTVELYPNKKAEVKMKKCKEFNLKLTITNDDVIPRRGADYTTNTIASLYNAVRGGNLYIDAHGGGKYLLGMLRGQFYLV